MRKSLYNNSTCAVKVSKNKGNTNVDSSLPATCVHLCLILCLSAQYQRFTTPFLRVGLLLEDLDSFAADVASRQLGGLPQNATVVTASVDRLAFATAIQHRAHQPQQPASVTVAPDVAAAAAVAQAVVQQQEAPGASSDSPMSIYQDLRMAGQVCWAGKSSMEVIIEISTRAAVPAVKAAAAAAATGREGPAEHGQDATSSSSSCCYDDGWIHRAVAHFVMVLRPTDTQHHQSPGSTSDSSPKVPQVVPSNNIEQRNYDAGKVIRGVFFSGQDVAVCCLNLTKLAPFDLKGANLIRFQQQITTPCSIPLAVDSLDRGQGHPHVAVAAPSAA